ncbi:MAG: YlxR family protein [Ilumatobacter sp.]
MPVRSCIGCRTRRPQPELVRVTRSADGIAVDGASCGRGAWLCRDVDDARTVVAECLDRAISRGQFARAWRGAVERHEVEALRDSLRRPEQRTD